VRPAHIAVAQRLMGDLGFSTAERDSMFPRRANLD
jgi:hypothetical protein